MSREILESVVVNVPNPIQARQPPPLPLSPTSSTPEAEVNYKLLCRLPKLKKQQLGKANKDIKTKCLVQEEHLQQAREDSDVIVKLVREAAYREKIRESTAHIQAL